MSQRIDHRPRNTEVVVDVGRTHNDRTITTRVNAAKVATNPRGSWPPLVSEASGVASGVDILLCLGCAAPGMDMLGSREGLWCTFCSSAVRDIVYLSIYLHMKELACIPTRSENKSRAAVG